MKKISKKLVSFLLVVVMVVSMSAMMFTVGAEDSGIKVGDTITLGTYPQSAIKDESGNVTGYNTEPIEWIVLKISDGKALLLSKQIIDGKAYNHTCDTVDGYYGNNYAHSDIRKWLIEDFYDTAFSTKDKNAIVPTVLDNSACATDAYASGPYTKYSSESTTDNVFLLSKSEIDTYASKCLEAEATDYALLNSRVSSNDIEWLTRTAGNNYYQIYTVQFKWGGWRTYFNWNNDYKITMIRSVRPAITVDLDKYEESVKGKFLPGYDPVDLLDKYIFLNQTDKISYWQCCKMFSPIIAGILNVCDDGTGGQCYGMATTTALFLRGSPAINSVTGIIDVGFDYVKEYPDSAAVNIRDMYNGKSGFLKSFVSKYKINLDDFIKYAHISQYSASIVLMKALTNNQYDMIIESIENYIDGGEPVVIGIRGDTKKETDCGHALLPVGIKKTENSYIVYVDDSNHCEKICELVFNLEDDEITGWSYEPLNWGSDKPNGKINCSSPCAVVLPFYEQNAISETVSSFFKSTYKLITTNSDNSITKDDKLIEILSENGTSSDNYLYWADESLESLTVSAVDKETEFSYCDDYVGISAVIPKGSKAECVVDDETFGNIVISDVKDNEVEISFETATGDSQDITTITISGTAIDNEVTATQTENGINVTGIANGTITLKKNDEVLSTKEITCSDGNSEIKYDKTGANSELSAEYEEKHDDSNNDGVCDDCNKVLDPSKSCHCACHTNIIVKFVLMIIDAILRAFGSSFDCSCGMSHR